MVLFQPLRKRLSALQPSSTSLLECTIPSCKYPWGSHAKEVHTSPYKGQEGYGLQEGRAQCTRLNHPAQAHLVVDISLTEITPGRQVNTAEDKWVCRGFMVVEHMGIDITAAVDLRLESHCRVAWIQLKCACWATLYPIPFFCPIPHSKSDTPSSPGVFHRSYKVGPYLGLLQEWGILPSNGDTRIVE